MCPTLVVHHTQIHVDTNLYMHAQPFRGFVQLPWWEVATNPDPGSDPAPFQAMLKGTHAGRHT